MKYINVNPVKSLCLGDWKDLESLIKDFWDAERYDFNSHRYNGEMDGVEWIFAYYSYENYEGQSFVLFKKNNQIQEVNASHCSCYGLEGQWKPEPSSFEVIKKRLEDDKYFGASYWGDGEPRFRDELVKFIDEAN
jgi:hypothetical protein